MRSWAAATLVFCTSAAVLVLEILAGRLVAPYLGVSLETYTGIIGTILAGIALGSAVGGRLADRTDPRKLLGPTLVLGGGLALLSLPVVTVVGPSTQGGGPVAIVVLTALAFLAPATVLSAVSPMAAKLRLADLGQTGAVVGGLSAAGTAGALVGTFLTGFVLVAAIPTRPIVLGLGTAIVVAGLVLWVRLAGGRPGPGALVGIVAVAGLGVVIEGPCQYETAYFCASVLVDEERPSGRILQLDNLRHSYVDLDDPTYLEFRYIRLMADVIDAELPGEAAVEALHVGGGGFTMPRWLGATRPGTSNVVLELDAEVVEINREELGLGEVPDLRIVTGDARTALDDLPTDAYDVVVGDAFGGVSVPWHLTTVEVMAELERVVRPDGVYVANIIDGGERRFLRAEMATLAEVFDHVAVIEPPEGNGVVAANHIVVASDRPLALRPGLLDPREGRVVPADEVAGMLDGVEILTDDFAPVDQLITRR